MIEWLVIGAALIGSMFRTESKPSQFSDNRSSSEKSEARTPDWRALWEKEIDRSRWIPQSAAHRIIEKHPPPWSFGAVTTKSEHVRRLLAEFAAHNVAHLASQKARLKAFFDTVEATPLTDEQAEACICMDDAVQIVAAAGSGKTSTMVAKTGYVLHEGLAQPEQILLLAFNNKAAEELRQRIRNRLGGVKKLENVTISTFHAFGYNQVLGKVRDLARWVESPAQESEMIVEIVSDLRAADPAFGLEWDLFRTVYGRAIDSPETMIQPRDDGYGNIRTANGEWVKSQEERLISDWLFFHGVRYEYESDYEYLTRTSRHRKYRPDFYYPDAQIYHEHFALDSKGNAPAHFTGDYVAGVQWKRRCHAEHGTELFETTSHTLRDGSGLQDLAEALTTRGIELAFDPERPTKGPQPITTLELARLIRAFQQHVKGGAISTGDIVKRLGSSGVGDAHVARSRRFLSLYDRVAGEWERRLREADCIDFDDMLIQAAEMIESAAYRSPFTMIFADEFQDSSRARVRLLKALLDQTQGRGHLCVVGDDWQSINRFAGADLSVMTEFARTFPHSSQLRLATTFRCPQSLCDASSKFVSANPRQLEKNVKTTNPRKDSSLAAFAFDSSQDAEKGLLKHLRQLHAKAAAGEIDRRPGQRLSVLLLGRYRRDEPSDLGGWQRRFGSHLDIAFSTVHSAKGLEADYVMILNMIEDTYGFPSRLSDDPVLSLAMPEGDDFPAGEERRVFYVALTRAKRQVRIYTRHSTPSRFLVEMMKEGALEIRLPDDAGNLSVCPQCKRGVLAVRSGRFGPFEGCGSCDFKRNLPKDRRGIAGNRIALRTPMAPGTVCPTCGMGIMTARRARFAPFVGCSRHPKCQTTAPLPPEHPEARTKAPG